MKVKKVGEAYDALYRTSPFEDSPKLYGWVTALAGVRPGDRVLDIGCGIGGALTAVTDVGAEAWGLDISREALTQAKARCPKAHTLLADGARTPFPDGCFRHIYNLGSLEHLTDLHGGLHEIHRLLEDSGFAWLLLPNLYYSGTIWKVIRSGYGPDHHQPIDRFATKSEWQDLLEAAGLHVVKSYAYHKGKWWKRLLPKNLCWHFLFKTQKSQPSATAALPPLTRIR